MYNTITANELKCKGISAVGNHDETVVNVHGQPRYVILSVEIFEHMREQQLAAALLEAQHDIEQGDYIIESVENHIKRINESGH